MPHEHQVIDFHATRNQGLSQRCAVDARIRLDLHIVFEHGDARLQDLVPPLVRLPREAEPVSADHHAVLQDYPVPDAAPFPNHRVRMREEVVSDAHVAINAHKAVQHGISSDVGVFVDEAVGAHVRALADVRG